MKKGDALDPGGLIAEAFRIEGIGAGECRDIFLDWALKMPADADLPAAATVLLARHEEAPADHPMRRTLAEGTRAGVRPRRRGGRAARVGPA